MLLLFSKLFKCDFKREVASNPQYLGYLFPTFSKVVCFAPYNKIGIVFILNNNNNNNIVRFLICFSQQRVLLVLELDSQLFESSKIATLSAREDKLFHTNFVAQEKKEKQKQLHSPPFISVLSDHYQLPYFDLIITQWYVIL